MKNSLLAKKKVLITGAKGVIGSLLCEFLNEAFDIIAIDRVKISGKSPLLTIDLSRKETINELINKAGPVDCIIHLAANPSPEAPWEQILKDNIKTTKNIYEYARQHSVKRVIFASSVHTYGGYEGFPHVSPLGRPLVASDPPRTNSDYADSKVYGEVLGRRYYDQYGLSSIALRIGHVPADNKPVEPYKLLWLSHRDLVQIFHKALVSEVSTGAYFVISNKTNRMFDIVSTIKELGFSPEDSI